MNPLGSPLFSGKGSMRNTKLAESKNINPPVPGFSTVPTNLLARIWNTFPGLQTATNLNCAKNTY